MQPTARDLDRDREVAAGKCRPHSDNVAPDARGRMGGAAAARGAAAGGW